MNEEVQFTYEQSKLIESSDPGCLVSASALDSDVPESYHILGVASATSPLSRAVAI